MTNTKLCRNIWKYYDLFADIENEDCQDTDPQKIGCANYVDKYCDHEYLKENCRKTCGHCKSCGGSCEVDDYKGDGYCDDGNNNCGCEYDGGDCCNPNANMDYCTKCECLETPPPDAQN